MRLIRSVTLRALCLLGCIPVLHAQFVVTYPGLQGADPTVAIYNTVTGMSVNFFPSLPSNPPPSPGATGAFKVLSTSTGSLHFFLSNTAGAAGTVTGTFYRAQTRFGKFTTPVTSAVLSPDDQFLIIGESTLHFFAVPPFSSGSSADLTPAGLAIPNATNVLDLAVDYDSQTVYALATDGTQSYLSTVNLAPLLLGETPAIAQTVPAPAGSTFLTMGPNGLLYISSPQTLTELDPVTLAPTASGAITLAINPGRPSFTPSGRYILAADLAPVEDGSAAVLIDAASHTVVGSAPFNGLVDPLSELYPISDSTVYAFVRGTSTIWTLQIGSNGGLIFTEPAFAPSLANAGTSINSVAAFGTSRDLGAPGRNAPQYLFIADTIGYLYIIDPITSAIVNQFFLGDSFAPPGEISYFLPTAGTTAASSLVYGNNQTIPLGGSTVPLVVRTLDANGYPSAGNYITFYLPAPDDGVSFNGVLSPAQPGEIGSATVVTGADGYAEVFYTAGTETANLGPVSIGTTTPDSASFTVTVGTGLPAVPTSLTIVSGQGQVVFQDPFSTTINKTPLPLMVLAQDASGNPVPNAPVVFAVLSVDPNVAPGPTTTVLTDSAGQASGTFYAPFAPPYPNFATELVTATSGTLSATFYVTSVANTTAPPEGCLTPPCPTVVPQITVNVVKPPKGTAFTGNAGSTLTGAVQVVIGSLPNAVPIPNVGISINTGTDATLPNARCSEPTGSGVVLTDGNGVANCDLILNSVAGTQPLSVFLGGAAFTPAFASLTITPNPPATVTVVSGDNQYGDTGSSLQAAPFTVQVNDASGNPIPFTPVAWQVTSGSLNLTPVSTLTDAGGMAAATGVLGSTPGIATMTVSAGSASATFTINIVTPAADIFKVSGDAQSTQTLTPFLDPLVIQVLDNDGQPANFAAVTFTAPGLPSATLADAPAGSNSLTVTTGADGMASVFINAGSPGPVRITAASTDAIASTTFSLTVLSPAPSGIQLFNAASFSPSISPGALVSLTGSTLTPTIQGIVSDPNALSVSGYIVTIGGYNAPILALVNANGVQQINVQVPFELTAGQTSMVVQTPQGVTTVDVTVASFAPGIFTNGTVTVNGSTFPQAVALRPDGSYISASNPAHRGESIMFFATGLGQTTPTASTGFTGVPGQSVYAPVFVAINHLSTSIGSAVYQVGTNGVYAITAQISSTAAIGPGQPLSLFVQDSTGVGYNAPDVYIPIAP